MAEGRWQKADAARVLCNVDGGGSLSEPGWLVIVEVQDNEMVVDNLPSSS